MNIAVLVKATRGTDGPAMDALSRRAVAQGVELAAAVGDGVCTAFSSGPSDAEDVLREAIAWGRVSNVMTFGVLLADSPGGDVDGLATARTIADALHRDGPFNLVLLGARAENGGTGLLGPQVAELLDLPFVESARYLSMQGNRVHVRGEQDDGWLQATIELPAVVSCAAGLIDPCEASRVARDLVPADLIRTLALGAPTATRPMNDPSGPIAVIADPARPDHAAALLAAAAGQTGGADQIAAITVSPAGVGDPQPEDVARAVADWAKTTPPSEVLAPDTSWGREVAGRVGVQLSTMAPITMIDPRAVLDAPDLESTAPSVTTITVRPRNRVRIASRTRRAD
jgi:electron transfer flavoprotein alpha/beta subunit